MPRYILIDDASGFVWGEAEAETPEDACRIVDEHLGVSGREYARVGFLVDAGPSGYYVHEAPTDFRPIDDGQDRDLIAAVNALPLAATVAITWDGPR